jgi:cellulose synthase/poly-beta-1,6-N-acetylglucosamine synthase-like glycosyltransferase
MGALLLLLGVPLYQLLVLNPLNYSLILNAQSSNHFAFYLAWINSHTLQYIIYRVLLIAAFALLLTLPFNLFRIIVAQEIVDQQERAQEEQDDDDLDEGDDLEQSDKEQDEDGQVEEDGMPAYAWRGRGFAILAAWGGLFGLVAYILGAVIGTLYVIVASRGSTASTPVPASFTLLYTIFSLISNTVGIGLLALSTLFFGALIARRGRNLWPTVWLLFGYMALAVAALLSGSAVATADAPGEQAALMTPAFLLFGLWVVWLGVMLVRLKAE